jgi:hypothetical protein
MAERWQADLAARRVRTQAELAAREGVSAMRVSQVLALLKLDPDILEAIRSLAPGTPERLVSERALRAITGLSGERQLAEVEKLAPRLLKRRKVVRTAPRTHGRPPGDDRRLHTWRHKTR